MCVCVCAPVFVLLSRSGQLKLHTLLSGPSSQQAHLEMRFETAINIELCWEDGGRGVFKIILSGVVPACHWAFGKGLIDRRNGSD